MAKTTGIWSLPVELYLELFAYLSFNDQFSLASLLPACRSLLDESAFWSRRYTRTKLRFTVTRPDERYHIHRLLRDYYFIVHHPEDGHRAIELTDPMVVTLLPLVSVSPQESDQFPSNLSFLQNNVLESRSISDIIGAMTFTEPEFLDDPIWLDGRNLPIEQEPNCNIWLRPTSCPHPLSVTKRPVSRYTIRDMLVDSISQTESTLNHGFESCRHCQGFSKASMLSENFDKPHSTTYDNEISTWTYRNPNRDWLGVFAFERYFVNVFDFNDGEVSGRVVKPWHWTSFWDQIVYSKQVWVPPRGNGGCVILGVNDEKRPLVH